MNAQSFIVQEAACPIEQWDNIKRGTVQWRTLFSADRTPTEEVTLGVAELASGQPATTLASHRHAQAEIYYILSGDGVVTIDNQPYLVKTGSAVFIPSNAKHSVLNTGDSTLRILYAFAADSFDEIKYEFDTEAVV